jgi:hypothetical protein
VNYDDQKASLDDFYRKKMIFDGRAEAALRMTREAIARGRPSDLEYKVRQDLDELQALREQLGTHPAAKAVDSASLEDAQKGLGAYRSASFQTSHGGDKGLRDLIEAQRLFEQVAEANRPTSHFGRMAAREGNWRNTSVSGADLERRMSHVAPDVQPYMESDVTPSLEEQRWRRYNESDLTK